VFAKLSREITVATKEGGGDASMNPRLRLAIASAKAESMPKSNIENAIQKGLGVGGGEDYAAIRYEGYAPGGVAVIVEALTDNRTRTASDVRSSFTKYGGNLGESGSVNFMFDRIGHVFFPAGAAGADLMFEAALEAGAQNVDSGPEGHEVTCAPEEFAALRDALEARFGAPERQGLIWRPNVLVRVEGEVAQDIMKLVEVLDDLDDVQSVITNFDVSDEVMAKLLASG
jgi:YebC/PmpR family DNA-binding regulatory protein